MKGKAHSVLFDRGFVRSWNARTSGSSGRRTERAKQSSCGNAVDPVSRTAKGEDHGALYAEAGGSAGILGATRAG